MMESTKGGKRSSTRKVVWAEGVLVAVMSLFWYVEGPTLIGNYSIIAIGVSLVFGSIGGFYYGVRVYTDWSLVPETSYPISVRALIGGVAGLLTVAYLDFIDWGLYPVLLVISISVFADFITGVTILWAKNPVDR
ncbi:MAG: hypothetical protein V5A34_05860 [Halapricum sp.]